MQTAALGCLVLWAACDEEPTVVLECDPAAQNCDPGRKCNPAGPALGPWSGTVCVADNAASGSPAGTPCFTGPDSTDTCGPDSFCLNLGYGEGVCTAFCDTSCPDDQLCVRYDDAIGLQLCATRCDLADPDCPLLFECRQTVAGSACIGQALGDGAS